jgi:hypothetical protein
MKMDGLYPAVFINLGYFQLKCFKVFLGLYSPATYAHRYRAEQSSAHLAG